MGKVRLNEQQRKVLGDKLADLGNIAIGSLVFGYVVRSDVFDVFSLTLGLAIAATAYICRGVREITFICNLLNIFLLGVLLLGVVFGTIGLTSRTL